VVRGYLGGSTRHFRCDAYTKKGEREMYGHRFPDGLAARQSGVTVRPIITRPPKEFDGGRTNAPADGPQEIVTKTLLTQAQWDQINDMRLKTLFARGAGKNGRRKRADPR